MSTVVAVLGLELLLQILTGNLGMPRYVIGPSDGRCVGLQPDTEVVYTGWALRVPAVVHDVNRLGYRGEPRERDKPPGVFRILMIGDSFTYGQAVPADQTMAAHLERLLRSEGLDVEVLNFGVPGLNIEENVEQYTRFAAQWEHDLVLLVVANNDLGQPPICNLVSERFTAWLIKRLRLARLYYFVLLNPAIENEERARPPRPRIEAALDTVLETSRTAGARFGVLMLHPKLDGPAEALDPFTSERGVPLLYLQGRNGDGDDALPVIFGEFHLTREGSRLAAERIARWLHASGLLPEAREPRDEPEITAHHDGSGS